MREQIIKQGKKLGLVGAALTAFVNQAMAAVPANVSTAMTDGATDAAAVAALGLLVIIGVAVVKYMRRGV